MTSATTMSTTVGRLSLPAPVMTASGTAGHGVELSGYGPLSSLGAVVVKSLSAIPWAGNPAPRVHPASGGGMVNHVGLQGPGVAPWRQEQLPALVSCGARVVASIWGRTVEEFAAAAALLAGAPGVVAVEVNVSCPNLDDGRRMFATSAAATGEAVAAAAAAGLPRWAKLSPAVSDLCEIAGAALDAGAEALTLVNTLPAAGVDIVQGRRWSGGLSGPPLHPVAVRAVRDCRQAFAGAGIVGVGGVASGEDAVELLQMGADAVQVGTAIFADPRAPWKVQEGVARWCRRHGVTAVREVVGAALR